MTKKTNNSNYTPQKKVSRPGVHAKTKTSKSKESKFYKKTYKGQGQ